MKLFTKFQIGGVTIKQVVGMKNRNDKVSFPILIPIPDFCQIYILPFLQFAQLIPPMSPLTSQYLQLPFTPTNFLSSKSHKLGWFWGKGVLTQDLIKHNRKHWNSSLSLPPSNLNLSFTPTWQLLWNLYEIIYFWDVYLSLKCIRSWQWGFNKGGERRTRDNHWLHKFSKQVKNERHFC